MQEFCDDVLLRIGAIIPVTSVPLACAALQSFDADYVTRTQVLERMGAMRDVLMELNGRVVRADRDITDTFERAYRMLRMRRQPGVMHHLDGGMGRQKFGDLFGIAAMPCHARRQRPSATQN